MEWVIVFKGLLFIAALLDGVYLGVLVHELGHAAAALIATRQNVRIKVGLSTESRPIALGRLSLELGLAGFRHGATSYDRGKESLAIQRIIIASGPLATLVLAAGFGVSLWMFEPWGWIWIILLAFFVANLRILIVSLWPIAYRAPDGSGETWKSDMLDLLTLGRR